jgi:hypothetical protein
MAPAGKSAAPRKTLDAIRDATGASEDDISAMLAECNYDVNEATAKLIESEPARPNVNPPAPRRRPPAIRRRQPRSRALRPPTDPFSQVVSKKDKRQQVRARSHLLHPHAAARWRDGSARRAAIAALRLPRHGLGPGRAWWVLPFSRNY